MGAGGGVLDGTAATPAFFGVGVNVGRRRKSWTCSPVAVALKGKVGHANQPPATTTMRPPKPMRTKAGEKLPVALGVGEAGGCSDCAKMA
jgi:hypothetical protein